MIDPSLSGLQTLIAKLRDPAGRTAAAFSALSLPLEVWESVPEAEQPGTDVDNRTYVHVGEFQAVGDEVIVTGSDIVADVELNVTIHVISGPRSNGGGGKAEAMRIAGAVARDLGEPDETAFEISDDGQAFAVVLCEIPTVRHFTDADGLTAHSVITARFELDPTEGL